MMTSIWLTLLILSLFLTRESYAECSGDCDGDGQVIVTELMHAVSMALGIRAVGFCPQFDVDRNDRVAVDEILLGLQASLASCPPDPTAEFAHAFPGNFFSDTAGHSQALGLVDLDGDGRLDVVLPDLLGNRIAAFRGKGDGTFATGRFFNSVHSPIAMAIADFNGDRKADVAVTSESFEILGVALGVGDGTLGEPQVYPVRLNPREMAAGDLDQNGTSDLVVVNRGTRDLSIFSGRGDGAFDAPVVISSGGASPQGIVIVDLNHDDDLDLVIANRGSGTLSVFLGEAGASFATPVTFTVPRSPYSIAAADFDEDGDVDLVVSSRGSDVVSFVRGNGDGTLGEAQVIVALENVNRLATDDLNGDGHFDLVVGAVINADTIMSLLGRGDGTFELAQQLSSPGGEVIALHLGDLNDDQIPDLVTDSGLVLIGNGDGTFATSVHLSRWLQGAADVNGDGHQDAISSDGEGLGVGFGRGDGSFEAVIRAPEVVRRLVYGDLNNDAMADAIGTSSQGSLVMLRGQRDGYSATSAVNAEGEAIAIVDMDHDGMSDLILSDSVLLGNGDATFQEAMKFTTIESFWCPSRDTALGDLNGDGHVDLVELPMGRGTACVFLGNGDGTLTFASRVPIGGGAESVAVGDFDEDGVLDLAVGRIPRERHLWTLSGMGDGTFGPPRLSFSGPSPGSLVVGDFNQDDHEDIAAVTEFDAVAVLLGRGDGTFHHPVFFGAGRGPGRMVAADFNEDGRIDLGITAMFHLSSTILFGR